MEHLFGSSWKTIIWVTGLYICGIWWRRLCLGHELWHDEMNSAPFEAAFRSNFQISTFLIRDLTRSIFDSTSFLDCLPGPRRGPVQRANCLTHCTGPQIRPLRDLSRRREVPSGPFRGPGRQSRKDVESKIDLVKSLIKKVEI